MGVGQPVTSVEGCGPHCRYEEENFVRLPTRRKASAGHQCCLQCATHTLVTCAGRRPWSQFHFG